MKKSLKKNPHAVALGKRGGDSRARNLTEARRKEISALGGRVRWERARARKAAADAATATESGQADGLALPIDAATPPPYDAAG